VPLKLIVRHLFERGDIWNSLYQDTGLSTRTPERNSSGEFTILSGINGLGAHTSRRSRQCHLEIDPKPGHSPRKHFSRLTPKHLAHSAAKIRLARVRS
jgi:hypothetical protein